MIKAILKITSIFLFSILIFIKELTSSLFYKLGILILSIGLIFLLLASLFSVSIITPLIFIGIGIAFVIFSSLLNGIIRKD